MRRLSFIQAACVAGLQWARGVLDNLLSLLGLAAVTAGVAAGGLLLHEPAWFLGVFGGLLLLLIFGEGAYRVWDGTDVRHQSFAGQTDLSLVDRLRLALKRGEGFAQQTTNVIVAEPALLALVRGWHDDIYKVLIREGKREEAKRWLNETDAIPEITSLNLAGAMSIPGPFIKQQVTCLQQLIARLENEGKG